MNLSAPAMSRTLGDPIFVQAGRKLMPTPHALALRKQVRTAVEQATQVLTPGEHVQLHKVTRRFNVRANDTFVGFYSGQLLEAMSRELPRAVLHFSSEEDDVERGMSGYDQH